MPIYGFGRGGGTVPDLTGNNTNCQFTGTPAPSFAPSAAGMAVKFPSGGTLAYVNVPSNSACKPTSGLTIVALFKAADLTTAQQLLRGSDAHVGSNYGYTLSPNGLSAGQYASFVRVNGVDYSITATIPDATHFHLVVVTCAFGSVNTLSMYVDGTLQATQPVTGFSIIYDSGNTLIGTANATPPGGTPVAQFTGQLSQLAILPAAMSAKAVAKYWSDPWGMYTMPRYLIPTTAGSVVFRRSSSQHGARVGSRQSM